MDLKKEAVSKDTASFFLSGFGVILCVLVITFLLTILPKNGIIIFNMCLALERECKNTGDDNIAGKKEFYVRNHHIENQRGAV